jgi:hypothetical protein
VEKDGVFVFSYKPWIDTFILRPLGKNYAKGGRLSRGCAIGSAPPEPVPPVRKTKKAGVFLREINQENADVHKIWASAFILPGAGFFLYLPF